MAEITRESLLQNIKNYNEAENSVKGLLLQELLVLLHEATKLGQTTITIPVGKYPVLDKNTDFFKDRFDERRLFYNSKWAHHFACDCDKNEPCTKYHLISL
jgi:hypothetical protein